MRFAVAFEVATDALAAIQFCAVRAVVLVVGETKETETLVGAAPPPVETGVPIEYVCP